MELGNHPFAWCSAQTVWLHFALEDEILRQEAVAGKDDRQSHLVEAIEQVVEFGQERAGLLHDRRMGVVVKGIPQQIDHNKSTIHWAAPDRLLRNREVSQIPIKQ